MAAIERKKMHVWGENGTQKVIFTDEASMYFAKGWRDHPSKVGKPLEVEMTPAQGSCDVEFTEIAPPPHTHNETRVKRAYNKRG